MGIGGCSRIQHDSNPAASRPAILLKINALLAPAGQSHFSSCRLRFATLQPRQKDADD
jgi:hypothetical protein